MSETSSSFMPTARLRALGLGLLLLTVVLGVLNALAQQAWIWQGQHPLAYDAVTWGYRLALRIAVPVSVAVLVAWFVARIASRSEPRIRASLQGYATALRHGASSLARVGVWVLVAVAAVTLLNGFVTPRLYETLGSLWPTGAGTILEIAVVAVGVPAAAALLVPYFTVGQSSVYDKDSTEG